MLVGVWWSGGYVDIVSEASRTPLQSPLNIMMKVEAEIRPCQYKEHPLLLSSEANNFYIYQCINGHRTFIFKTFVTSKITSILAYNFSLLFLIIHLLSLNWSESRIIETRCESQQVLAWGLIFQIVVCWWPSSKLVQLNYIVPVSVKTNHSQIQRKWTKAI